MKHCINQQSTIYQFPQLQSLATIRWYTKQLPLWHSVG